MTGSLGRWERDSERQRRDPRDSHAGVPRGIANDPMTVEVEMAGRIDEIADAAG
jgi:hypothetical protein